MASSRIGFVGLGDMGMPMARSLLKGGFELVVYDVRHEAVSKMVSRGARAASSCSELASSSDFVFSMVRDSAQNDAVLFGENGVWAGVKPGSVIIIGSTVGPAYCREVYVKAKQKGVQVVDCAVTDPSGQTHRLGGLTLMVGGDDDAVKRCWPVFQAMGKNVFHLGSIGNGQACKLVHQINAFNISTVTRESLNMGLKAGLDLPKMVEALSKGLGSTRGLQRMAANFKSRGQTAVAKPVVAQAPPARPSGAGIPPPNPLAKDRQLAMEMAEELGADMPIARFINDVDSVSMYKEYSAAMRRYSP
jgi:3-hydroxyisobutyrate dehydrogenase-like beta-hydroxyacid dehydrogenase